MLCGCQVSLQKGERVVVIDIAPDGWGAVSKEDGTEGYVPVDWLDLHTNSLSAPQTSAPAPREPGFAATLIQNKARQKTAKKRVEAVRQGKINPFGDQHPGYSQQDQEFLGGEEEKLSQPSQPPQQERVLTAFELEVHGFQREREAMVETCHQLPTEALAFLVSADFEAACSRRFQSLQDGQTSEPGAQVVVAYDAVSEYVPRVHCFVPGMPLASC